MAKTYGVKVSDQRADEFKHAWRAAHPRIVATWKQIQNAAINAVRHPGETYECGYPGRTAKYKTAGSFLWCLLPSGRAICYPYPKLLEGSFGPMLTYMCVPSQDDRRKGKIIADPKNASNWARVGTYGGSLFNNIVQGFCRDFLADCMLRLDEKGAAIVLHTHDDVNIETQTAKAEGARVAMQDIMRTPPAWAAGFPLYAKCDVMERYGK
jgi:DNA polymerase